MSTSYRVKTLKVDDRFGPDSETVHLSGLTSLDTTTLCGYTYPIQHTDNPRERVTCKLCLRVLDEMRERVRAHRSLRTRETTGS